MLEEEIADAIPEPERLLQEKEKASGLDEIAFLDYCYTLKRFTFNGNVINDAVFERICPELRLEYEQVIDAQGLTPQWLNWRNKHVYDKG